MLDALGRLLSGLGYVGTWLTLGTLLGQAVSRVVDDFKRNRATGKRLREAAAHEPHDASPGYPHITR